MNRRKNHYNDKSRLILLTLVAERLNPPYRKKNKLLRHTILCLIKCLRLNKISHQIFHRSWNSWKLFSCSWFQINKKTKQKALEVKYIGNIVCFSPDYPLTNSYHKMGIIFLKQCKQKASLLWHECLQLDLTVILQI